MFPLGIRDTGSADSRGDLLNEGFLGTKAPLYADATLLLEIAMGLGLLIGTVLARFRLFRQHAWCQSAIVLLNFAVIVITMIPSFRVHVSPKIPLRLGKAYYALATAHAALGSVTEIAGLYILLAAGTSVLPEKLRITKYKAWMRTVLVLWWGGAFLGIGNLRPLVRAAFVSEMKLRRPQKGKLSVSREFVLLIAHRLVCSIRVRTHTIEEEIKWIAYCELFACSCSAGLPVSQAPPARRVPLRRTKVCKSLKSPPKSMSTPPHPSA
jgi:hypothetical protein